MAPRADVEVDIRLRDAEITEEAAGHPLVVVLPGVNELNLGAPMLQRGDDRPNLHEVGPCCRDDGDLRLTGTSEVEQGNAPGRCYRAQ